LGAYAAGLALEGRWAQARELGLSLLIAALGTVFHPPAANPYVVGWQHWTLRDDYSRYISEWQAPALKNAFSLPFWSLLAVAFTLITLTLAKRRRPSLPWAPAFVAVFFAAVSLWHARFGVFFAGACLLLVFLSVKGLGWLKEEGRLAAGILTANFLFLGWVMPRRHWAVFDYRSVPAAAAEFMAQEQTALEPLHLFNVWEWGGYLGWRLSPWYKVFCDGRYIFHSELAESMAAAAQPDDWQRYLSRHHLDGALMKNMDHWVVTRKSYPDGGLKQFMRPWYLEYMPRERWALVYWDAQALLFVDRSAVPARWLLRHEYRYVRPKDDAAFAEAVLRHEIPAKIVAAEQARHDREIRGFTDF
jgi:hypothetical protein